LDICPRTKLLDDLKGEVLRWQEAGEQVIILADMKDEVTAPDLQKFCQDLHLVEAISSMHGRSTQPTHQRGSKAIDNIYMSRSLLKNAMGGFLSIGEVMSSDHRAVWLDIRAEHVSMVQKETVTRPACRRLKCQDPRIVAKYNTDLMKTISTLGWETKVDDLYAVAVYDKWSDMHTLQYEELDKELNTAKLSAEQRCQKFCAGHIPWTRSSCKQYNGFNIGRGS